MALLLPWLFPVYPSRADKSMGNIEDFGGFNYNFYRPCDNRMSHRAKKIHKMSAVSNWGLVRHSRGGMD
jgi:hypothetical protein